MDIRKFFAVAQWEFVEKARTKAFLISLVLTPAIMIAAGVVPSLLASRSDSETKKFVVYDETMKLREAAEERLQKKHRLDNGKPAYQLVSVNAEIMKREDFFKEYTPRVLKGDFTGLFLVPKNVDSTHSIEYRSDNVGNIRDISAIENALEKSLAEQRAVEKGISVETYKSLATPLETTSIRVTKSGEASEGSFLQTFGVAYGSVLVLFMLVISTGQILVRGLVEEKNNRIMEILISSCSPFELMMGKLLGLSGLGILQAMVWCGLAIGMVLYFDVPLSILAPLPITLIFVLCGYLLYASLLLGLGSLTTTDQEAQQMTSYATILLVIPISLISVVLQNPNSTIAKVMSFIPFTAPTIMAMRIAIQQPPALEIIGSLGAILLTTAVVIYFAAKVFRVAILVYGKRPTLPEILEFLREK
ncbi:MAG: ABC transporter permease [Candidatus Kapaibacterium sp.]|nr:MAG: ABC transporter permease [Candidatus Kapabacteria bacterium]